MKKYNKDSYAGGGDDSSGGIMHGWWDEAK